MTEQELQNRANRSQILKVLQVEDGSFYVESSKGDLAYKVISSNGHRSCTCNDFAVHIKKDPQFQCKHILAVMNNGQNNKKPKLDDRFISNIQGKEFVLYSGLLDLAHQKGLLKIHVEPIQFPSKDNNFEAICKAVVESKSHEVFVELGDANPNNVNRKIAVHILRMAATRAKARALRDFTNIGITCLEELADFDEVCNNTDSEQTKTAPKRGRKPAESANSKPSGEGAQPSPNSASASIPRPSEAQLKAIENIAKRRGMDSDELEDITQQNFGTSFKNITSAEASGLIRLLQAS